MCDQHSEFGNQGKVLLHVGGKDHVHHNAPELPLLALGQPPQEVAVQLLIPQQPASTAMVRPTSAHCKSMLGRISCLQASALQSVQSEYFRSGRVFMKDLTAQQRRQGSTGAEKAHWVKVLQ